jgi:hypothetical protein
VRFYARCRNTTSGCKSHGNGKQNTRAPPLSLPAARNDKGLSGRSTLNGWLARLNEIDSGGEVNRIRGPVEDIEKISVQ